MNSSSTKAMLHHKPPETSREGELRLKRFFNRSLKRTILWVYIPMILVFTFMTGGVSYLVASQQLRANVETGIRDTMAQTEQFLNDRLTAILTDMTALDRNSDFRSLLFRAGKTNFTLSPQDYVVLSQNMDKVYSDFYGVIDSVFVYYNQGAISAYRQDFLQTEMPFDLSRFLHYPYASASQMYWLNVHDDELNPGQRVLSLYKWLGGPGSTRMGLILIQLQESYFRNLLSTPQISENGYLLLVSPDGFLSFKSSKAPYEVDETQLRQQLVSSPSISGRLDLKSKERKDMVVLYDTVGINKWKIAAIYPKDDIYAKVSWIQYVTLALMGSVLVLSIWLSNRMAHVITKPISRLTRQVNSIEQGNLEVRGLQTLPDSEVGILSKGIRDMLGRIKDLLSQVEYEQEQKRLLELSVLQTQIQPHFLYNTLYSIHQLCEMGETEEASIMVTSLSNFFRISISKGSEIIPVATEIEHIHQYLIIQKMRYGDTFTYETEVSDELLPCPIVKLTLQPLVENAIYHGVKKVRHPGVIRITGYIEGGDGFLQIADNGYGMSEERLQLLKQSLAEGAPPGEEEGVGFGVINVHRRLQLHYGPSYGLSYESMEGEGTRATVKFPIQPNK